MLRRALLWLLPALIALAFAAPMSGAGSVRAAAFEQNAVSDAVSNASVPIPRDGIAAAWSQQSADDDDTDRLAGAGEMPVAWYRVKISVPLCSESDVPLRAHYVCTAFPRGPPHA